MKSSCNSNTYSYSTFLILILSLNLIQSTFCLSQQVPNTAKDVTIHTTNTSYSRRNWLQNTLRTTFLTTTTFTTLSTTFPQLQGQNANALELCRAKARNCIRTKWTAPESMNKGQAIDAIKEALNSYPQSGQNGIDCNGWTIVKDSLLSSTADGNGNGTGANSVVRLEYRSCVGPAALAINLAQPFVDDVILELDDSSNSNNNNNNAENTNGNTTPIVVQVKSSSRMGSSDLFVNKKRIEFLGDKLRQQGWIVPSVKYGI